MGRKWFQSGLPKPDGGNGLLAGPRQVQRGTIDHINQISAPRMRVVPTPVRNNPTSGMFGTPISAGLPGDRGRKATAYGRFRGISLMLLHNRDQGRLHLG